MTTMRSLALALLCASAAADFVATHETGEKIAVKTNNKPFTAHLVQSTRVEHPIYDDAIVEFYKSNEIKLMTGEAWFTLPDVSRLPMPRPGVPWAILGASYDIVATDTGVSVALSEMYSHHWLVYDQAVGGSGFNIGCGGEGTFVSNVYGAGGEMRGITYNYPPGHGEIYQGAADTYWSANMHFIRTHG